MSQFKHTVYVVDGCRSPFLKAIESPGPFSAAELSVIVAKNLFLRSGVKAKDIDECILGCVIPAPDEANIARIVSLRAGCSEKTPAWTVQRNCASGLQAIDSARMSIHAGNSKLILAGGVEVMSRAPMQWNADMVRWFNRWIKAKSWRQRLFLLAQWRFSSLRPVISLLCGLSDSVVNLSMGQTAEILANDFSINRQRMDEYSAQSHQRLAEAIKNHYLDEIVPLFSTDGEIYEQDTGLREETTPEKLSQLKPVFERYGNVTAGNSAQITDGAAVLLIASDDVVEQQQLKPKAKIIDIVWQALDPRRMGLGPAYAITSLLAKNQLKFKDIDYWEINEAFAAQVLACLQAMQDKDYAKAALNKDVPLGVIDLKHLNIDGGAISIGHPIGASGARIVLHLSNILMRKNARYGIASLCIGGGQGGAILLENINFVGGAT